MGKASAMAAKFRQTNFTQTPVAGTQSIFIIPAPGAGAKNVLTTLHANLSTATAPVASDVGVQIMSGATILWSVLFRVPPVADTNLLIISLSNLWLEANENEAMTIRFSVGVANARESLNGLYTVVPVFK